MAVKSKNEMGKKKYILIESALGIPAGSVISGPVPDVLAANGKAAPAQEETRPAKTQKEGARKK